MSRTSSPHGANLRLVAVLALTGLAVGSTIVGSAASEQALLPEDDALTTSTTSTQSTDDVVADAVSDSSSTTSSSVPSSSVPDAAAAGDGIDVVVVGETDGVGVVGIDTLGDERDEAVMSELLGTEMAIEPDLVTPACEPTAPAETETENDDDAFHVENFSSDASAWDALSGSWSIVDGEYHQIDGGGYDLISQLRVDPPERYRVSVTLRPLGGELAGGLILGQPLPAERAGATIVDFTDGGGFLRWGKYDNATGQYQYVGGVAMSDDFDPAASHELTVEVRDERTMVTVDGVEVGSFDPLPFGRLGLVTSRASIAFDDVRIVEVGR